VFGILQTFALAGDLPELFLARLKRLFPPVLAVKLQEVT
jgi:hypothetical protein